MEFIHLNVAWNEMTFTVIQTVYTVLSFCSNESANDILGASCHTLGSIWLSICEGRRPQDSLSDKPTHAYIYHSLAEVAADWCFLSNESRVSSWKCNSTSFKLPLQYTVLTCHTFEINNALYKLRYKYFCILFHVNKHEMLSEVFLRYCQVQPHLQIFAPVYCSTGSQQLPVLAAML